MATIERSSDLAVVGANGGGWVTDLGVKNINAPADISTVLSTLGLNPLGAISDDGLTYGFDEGREDFTPWGLTAPFRTVTTKSVRTFGLTLWETNRAAVKSVFYRLATAQVTPDATGNYHFSETASPDPDRRSWVFDVIDGQNIERYFVPAGEISDRSDVKFRRKEMAGYEIKVTAYPDNLGNTVYHTGRVVLTRS